MPRGKKLTGEDLMFYKTHNIGQALMEVANDYQKTALTEYEKRGHYGLQPSYYALLLNLGLEGARLTDLAKLAGISRQAMGQIIDEVECLGYVERKPVPNDRRAKVISFTDRGYNLIKTGTDIGMKIQQRYASYITKERMELLQEILTDLRRDIRSHSKQSK